MLALFVVVVGRASMSLTARSVGPHVRSWWFGLKDAWRVEAPRAPRDEGGLEPGVGFAGQGGTWVPSEAEVLSWLDRPLPHPEAPCREPLHPLLSAHLLDGHVPVNGWCVACGFDVGRFVVDGREVVLCPLCLVNRIAALLADGFRLPAGALALEAEAKRRVSHQIERESEPLTVSWDDLYRCTVCGRMTASAGARGPVPGAAAPPPPCAHCGAAGAADPEA